MTTTYAIVSTYPPTQCGLATFSKALLRGLRSPHDHVGVLSVVERYQADAPAEVGHQWVGTNPGALLGAAAYLDRHDVVILQHEFGIFCGPDGSGVLDLVRATQAPVILVLHTVLVSPTPRQRAIIEELVDSAAVVVTMTETGRQRLLDHYTVDAARLRVVPHGAPDDRLTPASVADLVRPRGPVVLTWGLLGEGKGIEWGIDAMALLTDLRPAISYDIVGQTHPHVRERVGERYRAGLVDRAAQLGVCDAVSFDDRYLSGGELQAIVRRADVVLLPYDSQEQVTSGVLVEAVSAGKPVVSTDFPHARELLASGAGLLVPRRDPQAIADALRRVVTEPGLASRMRAEAERLAPTLRWPAVATQYRDMAAGVLSRRMARVTA
jgi:glycosyltransferase involved in cell wall biosynthesis